MGPEHAAKCVTLWPRLGCPASGQVVPTLLQLGSSPHLAHRWWFYSSVAPLATATRRPRSYLSSEQQVVEARTHRLPCPPARIQNLGKVLMQLNYYGHKCFHD